MKTHTCQALKNTGMIGIEIKIISQFAGSVTNIDAGKSIGFQYPEAHIIFCRLFYPIARLKHIKGVVQSLLKYNFDAKSRKRN